MPLITKRIELDGLGEGSVTVGPCFYAGSSMDGDGGSATVVADKGGSLGVDMLTSGTMVAVEGQVVVTNGPAGETVGLFFDFAL